MKKEIKYKNFSDEKINRKQAIKKVGVTALTAATLIFLQTKNAAAASNVPTSPGSGWD